MTARGYVMEDKGRAVARKPGRAGNAGRGSERQAAAQGGGAWARAWSPPARLHRLARLVELIEREAHLALGSQPRMPGEQIAPRTRAGRFR